MSRRAALCLGLACWLLLVAAAALTTVHPDAGDGTCGRAVTAAFDDPACALAARRLLGVWSVASALAVAVAVAGARTGALLLRRLVTRLPAGAR